MTSEEKIKSKDFFLKNVLQNSKKLKKIYLYILYYINKQRHLILYLIDYMIRNEHRKLENHE